MKAPKVIEQAVKDMGTGEPSSERLLELKALVKRARALAIRINNGQELLGTLSKENNRLLMDEIPDLMSTLGVPSITVEGEGNEPPFSASKKPFYSAGLPESAGEEDREAGFNYLTSIGHGDLIKHEVSFLFPTNTDPKLIDLFIKAAMRIRVQAAGGSRGNKPKLEIPYPTSKRSINTATLTSWLKKQVESGFVPKLGPIRGFIGQKVVIKTVEEK